MKKHISIISAAVLLGSIVLLSGCNKSPFSHEGELITFGTVAAGSQTRTAYGTDFTDPNTNAVRQRIDWKTNDVVRIVSDYAKVLNDGSNLEYADYTVTTVTEEADGTSSAVVNTNPNGLCWSGAEKYTFWGVYPSTTTITAAGVVSADFIQAEQSLPTGDPTTKTVGEGDDAITYNVYTPDISGHVLTAIATDVKENDEKPQVKLHFKPAFTAIEFNLSSQDDDIEMTQLQLVADAEGSDYLAGPFTMNAGDLSSVAVTTASASKTVTLSTGDGLTLKKAEGASLTMFILPKNNASTLTLRLTSKEDDGTKTSFVKLLKGGQPYVFEAGKKYRINGFKAPGNSWKIFIATEYMRLEEWGDPVGTDLIVE